MIRGGALVAATLVAVLGASVGTGLPSAEPVALIATWAQGTPVAGLWCSGVLLDERHLATAGHCLDGRALRIVSSGSLCDRIDDSAPSVGAAGGASGVALPSGDDLAVVAIDRPTAAPPVRTGIARPGTATVYGFGLDPGLGRPACRPTRYRGELGRCAPDVGAAWCLSAAAAAQLCGGSSGAPVFMSGRHGIELIGVVSGGPGCGDPGPVVVATFAGQVINVGR